MPQSNFSAFNLDFLYQYAPLQVVQHGLELHEQQAASLHSTMDVDRELLFEFHVRGREPEDGVFETTIFINPRAELHGECTCWEEYCEHEIAAILYLMEAGIPLFDDAPVERTPEWKKTLDQVLPPVEIASENNPVCIFFDYERGNLRAHLGTRGKRGWIKGDARWHAVDDLECGTTIERLLTDIHNASMQSGFGIMSNYGWGWNNRDGWIDLDEIALPTLWSTLQNLRAAGVELIEWSDRLPVELSDEPASLHATVKKVKKDQRLQMKMELHHGGERVKSRTGVKHRLMGVPATVAIEIAQTSSGKTQIILRELDKSVDQGTVSLFHSGKSIRVEGEEQEEFERDYLPRLQQLVTVSSPDNSYIPPVPKPSTLELAVTPVVDAGNKLMRIELRWQWNRGAAGIVDPEHEDGIREAVTAAGASFGQNSLPREKAIPFLAETLPELQKITHVQIKMAEGIPEFQPSPHPPQVSVGIKDGERDWFDLNVEVTVGGEQVGFAELFSALSLGEKLFVLPSGTYFSLDTPEFDQLRRIIEEAKTLNDTPVSGLKVSRYQVDLWQELVETGIVAAQEHEWWSRISSLSVDQAPLEVEIPGTINATLRDYQIQGFQWLETLRRNNLGGILADDMGLGKTLQIITMIAAAHQEQPAAAPFLVIAPTSVVGNWVREVEKFAPDLRAVAVEGTGKRREASLEQLAAGAQVVVTSYTLFRLEFEAYAALPWSGIIFDEAQMIKNHTSKAYKYARLLDVPVKFAVTGTPLENNLMELWALVSLVCPGLIGGKTHFTEFYRTPIEKEQEMDKLALLQRRLRPFLLRRLKELVAADLPAKVETVTELDLYPKHRRIYDRRLQRERQKVLGLVDDMDSNRFEIFRSLTLLRQLALDTDLAGEGESPSVKLEALAEMLGTAAQEGHRVLVLSQFTRFLGKARETATAAGIESLYLDGKTRNRQKLIDAFRDGTAPVFFISLKAGGFGLNLTEADYVVLLDPWWNPATEAQAVDRAHRIGQTRQVMVYRMVATNTIESKVMALKQSKAALFERVLDEGSTIESNGLDISDIKALMG